MSLQGILLFLKSLRAELFESDKIVIVKRFVCDISNFSFNILVPEISAYYVVIVCGIIFVCFWKLLFFKGYSIYTNLIVGIFLM